MDNFYNQPNDVPVRLNMWVYHGVYRCMTMFNGESDEPADLIWGTVYTSIHHSCWTKPHVRSQLPMQVQQTQFATCRGIG
jgi:hypothetical protein